MHTHIYTHSQWITKANATNREWKTHCFYSNTSHFQPHRINNSSVAKRRLLKFSAKKWRDQEAQNWYLHFLSQVNISWSAHQDLTAPEQLSNFSCMVSANNLEPRCQSLHNRVGMDVWIGVCLLLLSLKGIIGWNSWAGWCLNDTWHTQDPNGAGASRRQVWGHMGFQEPSLPWQSSHWVGERIKDLKRGWREMQGFHFPDLDK